MNEEEKEAMKLLENIKEHSWTTLYIMSRSSKDADILLNLIKKQQTEIEKKDLEITALKMEHEHDVKMIDEVKGEAVRLYKIIDLMAEYFEGYEIEDVICLNNKEEAKQYFREKEQFAQAEYKIEKGE